MVEYINTENFKEWLIRVLKPECWWETTFDLWCEDVWRSYCNSGSPSFEVDHLSTKSKLPECYSFEAEERYCVSEYDREFFNSFYGKTLPEDIERMQKEGITLEELDLIHEKCGVEKDWQDWLEDYFDHVKTVITF